jgi:hypothetical protein
MASSACTDWSARSYLGGWNSWTTNFNIDDSDGYCYKSGSSTAYAFCFSFKTPEESKFLKSTNLKFTIPIIRTSSSFATSGTLYFKLFASDPTPASGRSLNDNLKPTSSNCDASCSWSSKDQEVHQVSFTINSASLKPATRYYITVAGSKLIGIGYLRYTPAAGWWKGTFNYSTYTNGTAPSISITDRKNNTVTVSGALGKNGESNVIKSATLYYTLDGSDPSNSSTRKSFALTATSGGSYSKDISITKKCTLKAYVECVFEHNTTSASATSASSVIYYVAPTKPGVPVISYTKNRLTIKENWTYTWKAATAGNADSPVKGYRIRLYRNNNLISNIVLGSGNIITKGNNTSGYVDRESTSCTVTFNPTDFGFVPGDTVKLGIFSYARNGANQQLFNGGGSNESHVLSAASTVQNAGVVHTKVSGAWKEGQVYVKINGAWKEAETVSVKVNGTWHESE